jgi:hypothetical protein
LRVVAGELPVGLQIVARNRDGPLLALPANMWIGAFPTVDHHRSEVKRLFLDQVRPIFMQSA